jgi:hypothetical protein
LDPEIKISYPQKTIGKGASILGMEKKAMARCGLSLSKRTTVFHKNELQRNIGCYFLGFRILLGNESAGFKWKNSFSLKSMPP